MSHLEEDELPNLFNDFFERRFQVIKGGVHCFVFGLAFPDHSTHVQRTDEGLGIHFLSNLESNRGILPIGQPLKNTTLQKCRKSPAFLS